MEYTASSVSLSLDLLLNLAAMQMSWLDKTDLAEIQSYVDHELAAAMTRSLIAKTIAGSLASSKFVIGSNSEIGNLVHKTLQSRYLMTYGLHSDITIERYFFIPKIGKWRTCLYVTGPTVLKHFNKGHVPLRKMAVAARDPDAFWQLLRFALNGARFRRESWLRADLVDRKHGVDPMIWEIKPIGSAVEGVWQETFYRVSFNVLRAALEKTPDLPKYSLTKELRGGSEFGPPNTLSYINVKAPLSALLNKRNKEIGTVAGLKGSVPAIAVPFEFGLLPGIVLYTVLTVSMDELFKIVKDLMARAMKDASKIAEDALKRVGDAVLGLLPVLVVLAVLAILFAYSAPIMAAISAATAALQAMPAAAGAALGLGGLVLTASNRLRLRSPEQFGLEAAAAVELRKELKDTTCSTNFGETLTITLNRPATRAYSEQVKVSNLRIGGLSLYGVSTQFAAALLQMQQPVLDAVIAELGQDVQPRLPKRPLGNS